MKKYTDGTVKAVELEDEDGSAVYSVHVTAKEGKHYDVKVDAISGKITKAENDRYGENENE
ncbi:PepSY domain-containing protein [Peribacillus kribbensis]|uniref:PepSY domain-containing protein n=1 Tax=Peribacillus kribbensis TaxID=356658 RepID=UPI0003F75E65|nr:PepSY domain-containing protein [Peribacillus kribbensis]